MENVSNMFAKNSKLYLREFKIKSKSQKFRQIILNYDL